MQKCDRNCFRCSFSDCMNDDLSLEEFQQSDELDREIKENIKESKIKSRRNTNKKYRNNNIEVIRENDRIRDNNRREQNRQRNLNYYYQNRESILLKQKLQYQDSKGIQRN